MRFQDIDWRNWRPREEATLLFVVRDGQVLLIHKKRGIGAGKVNGPGGRVDPGETPVQAAVREVREELGVTPTGVLKSGQILFQVSDGTAIRIHVFRATGCHGAPRETEEAVPLWASLDAIPYDRMWADDRHWFPPMLAGECFEARCLFDGDTLLGHDVMVSPAWLSCE